MKYWAVLVVFGAASVGSAMAQTLYTGDGAPTGLEEEIRWRVNRGRFDSASENLTRGTSYTDIPATTGPLAPNQSLTLAARHQSEDMARQNLFQHATVPGSAYYNPVTQPNPWDRMLAEGYVWSNAGENIAAGYSGAESVYVGWWNSTGHRQNMYNSALREIGDGFFYTSTSTYKNYYTMDLGTSGSGIFFTDTLFRDMNGNGVYDQGEGISNIVVKLMVGGALFSYGDISSSVGSFAVPIQSLPISNSVQVILSNTASSSVSLTVPQDYHNFTLVTLAPGESRVFGSFIKVSSASNIGFRDVTPTLAPIVPPRLVISPSGPNVLLTWSSELGLEYQPQWTTNLLTWSNGVVNFLAGTGTNMSWADTSLAGSSGKSYRLAVRRP